MRPPLSLVILLSFCGGLMLPVLVMWMYILNNASAPLNEQATTIVPDVTLEEVPPPIRLRFKDEVRTGDDILTVEQIDGIGPASMTPEFAKLLSEQPSCDLFKNEGHDFPEYFKEGGNCFMTGNEEMILIGALGVDSAYEGLPGISDSIIAIPKEGAPKIFYRVHASLGDHVADSEHIASIKTDLFQIMLDALHIDTTFSTPTTLIWKGSAYYIDPQGALKLIDTPGYLGIYTDGESTFDSYNYQSAYLSLDGSWIALGMINWEWSFLRFYNIKTGTLHNVEGRWAGTGDLTWLPNGHLLESNARCGEGPKWEKCGPFESVSATTPWIMD